MVTQMTQVPATASVMGLDTTTLVAIIAGVVAVSLIFRFVVKRGGKAKVAPAPTAAPAGPMFGTLLATQPGRDVSGMAGSAFGSVVFHAGLIGAAVWATALTADAAVDEEPEYTVIELHEDVPPPPPPPPPIEIREQTVAPIEVARGFQTLTIPEFVPPEIPPPQVGVTIREEDFSGVGRQGGRADGRDDVTTTVDDLMQAPVFTPFTIRPELTNTTEVRNALVRYYPPLLRDAGIGGRTLMWFFIDENGTVIRTQIKESSGYDALDETAQRVAGVMKFSPAMNRDRRVPVWIEIPIVFTAR